MIVPSAQGLCIAGGLAAIGIGVWLAMSRWRNLARLSRKRGRVQAAMSEGWGAWFFRGFSDATLGARWVVTMALLACWLVLGIGLLCVGACLNIPAQ